MSLGLIREIERHTKNLATTLKRELPELERASDLEKDLFFEAFYNSVMVATHNMGTQGGIIKERLDILMTEETHPAPSPSPDDPLVSEPEAPYGHD